MIGYRNLIIICFIISHFYAPIYSTPMKDELRESLFICLNTEEIIYQVDNDNNKYVDHAVTRC